MRKMFAVAALAVSMFLSVSLSAKRPSHIVFVGLDGWGAYTMPKADMP